MKCPYRNFEECIIEKCPCCNYKENKKEVTEGRYPTYMNSATAVEKGLAWKSTRTTYEFVSCKLVENGVQPVPPKKEIINNHNETRVVVRKSIF